MGLCFTREELEETTAKDLKRLCVDELGLVGMSKKPKDEVVNAILDDFSMAPKGSGATAIPEAAVSAVAPLKGPVSSNAKEITGIEFAARSIMTKPAAPKGGKTTTTIHVSCGASSGNFPVAGKTVKEVGDFLREVLNVDELSTGIVNGKEVAADYKLKDGDNLEYLKPAGKKG